MIKIEMIGNLGADAEVKEYNGRKFISFRIAHTDKWIDRATNQEHTSTVWASCTINGDGGNLRTYLKKGVKVFVRGSMSMNIYSSPKSHQMECGLNISVWEIELCGGTMQQTSTNAHQSVIPTSPQSTAVSPQTATPATPTSSSNGKPKTPRPKNK